MTIFTPYMNVDLYQSRPQWQKIERYEYCTQIRTQKTRSALDKFREWLKGEGKKAA